MCVPCASRSRRTASVCRRRFIYQLEMVKKKTRRERTVISFYIGHLSDCKSGNWFVNANDMVIGSNVGILDCILIIGVRGEGWSKRQEWNTFQSTTRRLKARARALESALILHATWAIEPCLPPVQPFKEGINLYLSLTFTLRLSSDKSWALLGERGMMMKSRARARYNSQKSQGFFHFMYIKHASAWKGTSLYNAHILRSILPSSFFFCFLYGLVSASGGETNETLLCDGQYPDEEDSSWFAVCPELGSYEAR